MKTKDQLPPGPWHDEPDSKDWEAYGLKCVLKRGPTWHWCGYVGVPKEHPAYGIGYYPMDDWYEISEDTKHWRRHVSARAQVAVQEITVHGGLTWASKSEDDLWLFGFDCAHAWDLCPGMRKASATDTYRDINYAISETEKLAKQLAAIKPLPSLAELGNT